MAIAVHFHPKGMTLKQFEETHRRLDEAGASEPKGRIHHSCFGEDGELMVFDIWESPETFQAFGDVLMPILAEVQIDAGEPTIMPVHRLQQACQAEARAEGPARGRRGGYSDPESSVRVPGVCRALSSNRGSSEA